MMEQVRLCAVWPMAWLFLEPDIGLDHCPTILLSCFRARTSDGGLSGGWLHSLLVLYHYYTLPSKERAGGH